ncbi:MAG: hypothetical protein COU35_03855 [Candidatus Magasanikbacteria bacterium CG10_big_fil_rev_8_21_14_0_10_47_10]|uniref:Acylneuraminate cytidylyltransferase n=1 Tax=Candidatus Magasanikbacteria bacterium CG10_big_fil_rev_8_21_14_0_10_47_10 TaxID=1974652 RepID=A0A2H0TPU0_9BACT|nr:MAG: hypothetical protein COU35_03855 [Candidatus Magasanikbacteria bacterium CG10_big_fil_rev_8_21_14_0_10_47_10]
MKVVAIIQARMGSSRLPGKMLLDIAGRPAIAHVVDAVKRSLTTQQVVLATTTDAKDDPLATWAEERGLTVYRGSEDDVLDRYYQAAKKVNADSVIRITGDCPFMDPAVIDRIVQEFQKGGYDYVANTQPATYPDGIDVEVFSFQALERAWNEAGLSSEREHVTPYIWKNPTLFAIGNIVHDADWSGYRWTLDTPEDLDFLRHVAAACKEAGGPCSMADIRALVDAHPQWRELNGMYERNEGYIKSLAEDNS